MFFDGVADVNTCQGVRGLICAPNQVIRVCDAYKRAITGNFVCDSKEISVGVLPLSLLCCQATGCENILGAGKSHS
jgi:hypothetical protein